MIPKHVLISSRRESPSSSLSLWYESAGSTWLEYLPIGNGSLGGMISGGYPRETIQLNIDTLWAGGPHDYSNSGAVNYLDEIRQLIDNEKWMDAQNLLNDHFFGQPARQAPYQPVGDVFIDFFENNSSSISINDYQRELNLEQSLFKTRYSTDNGISYTRTCFSSYPDQCILYRIQSSVSYFHLFFFDLIERDIYLVSQCNQLCHKYNKSSKE